MVYALDIDSSNFAPAKFGSIASFFNLLAPLIVTITAIIFLMMSLYGGFTWVTAGDNPENIKKAQKIFTFGGIGLFIVVLSFFIIKLLGLILNVKILP